ncbi:MAG: hypothetical protein ACR2PT_06305 [Endozoicomonas sp.]
MNAERLTKFRKRVLDKLNQEMRQQVAAGMSVSEARKKLAQIHLRKNSHCNWPAFFSSIRAYLGKEADSHLRMISYTG